MIDRAEFVRICTQEIQKARKKITVGNQLSGYKKYHREIKENNYIKRCRDLISSETRKSKCRTPLFMAYEIIKHYKIGNCGEFAKYLSVKIAKKLNKKNVRAQIDVVGSKEFDHAYVRVQLRLAGEKHFSEWEIDAWDPRIIDITTKKDGSRKNEPDLDYGINPYVNYSIDVSKLPDDEMPEFSLPAPIPGKPERCPTPEGEMLDKHRWLYTDKTVEIAIEEEVLSASCAIRSLQSLEDSDEVSSISSLGSRAFFRVPSSAPSSAATPTPTPTPRDLDLIEESAQQRSGDLSDSGFCILM